VKLRTHAAMSNAMLRSWATRFPGFMPKFPGAKQTTAFGHLRLRFAERIAHRYSRLVTLPCLTSTPLGFPVVPINSQVESREIERWAYPMCR
jgi:hypothetical protein